MNLATATQADMILLRNDMNDLKRDMANIAKHLGSGAAHSVDEMTADFKDNSDKFMRDMSHQGQRTVKAVQHEIGTHPTLTASLILAASLLTARLMMK